MRSRRSAAAATAVAVAALLALAAQAFGLPPFSTTPKTSPGSRGQAQLSGIDTGCHATFDRFVIRISSGNPGYDVRYVSRIVADPSGNPVALQGSKKIKVVIRPARGHTVGGANVLPSTLTPRCPDPTPGQEGRGLRGGRVVRARGCQPDRLPGFPPHRPDGNRGRRRALTRAA